MSRQIARHIIVSGRVQGVFYRAWTVETANALHLTGCVRNRLDGDVEIWVEGDTTIVERFIDQLWIGPPAARVDRLHTVEKPVENFTGFEKRATL